MDFEKSLKFIKNLGVNYVEIHSLWDKNIEELNRDEISLAKKLLNRYKFKVSNISSTIFLQCSLLDNYKKFNKLADYFITISGDYESHLKYLKFCTNLCEIFNTDKIRIFGFIADEAIDDDKLIEIVYEKFGKAVEIAEKAGITLTIENCPFTYMYRASLIKDVIENINSNNLKALWDPGNVLRVKGVELIPFPEEYKIIKQYISHMHVKDVLKMKPEDEECIVPLGKGDVDYEGILRNLNKDGYEGVVSLEPELFSGKEGSFKDINESFENLNKIYRFLK